MIKSSLWLVVVFIAFGTAWQALAEDEPSTSAAASSSSEWVDESRCQSCHSEQHADWQNSHHQLAMQPATDSTVLGNFDRQSLISDTETSRFFRRDGGFWINTPNAEGKPTDYPVAYTFGVEPLQQYFLQLSDGRLQSHGAAWDVPEQRWFHLYDGDGVDHHHRLHWSGAQQNADYMCIECHTTGFQRDYDPVANTYSSQWQALGVGCQSCHGPAAGHLQWAEKGNKAAAGKGFEANLMGTAREPETCARCHSRRMTLDNGYTHGNQLLDDYLPVILSADLYEVDGKIKDEVFEYGSFQQAGCTPPGWCVPTVTTLTASSCGPRPMRCAPSAIIRPARRPGPVSMPVGCRPKTTIILLITTTLLARREASASVAICPASCT